MTGTWLGIYLLVKVPQSSSFLNTFSKILTRKQNKLIVKYLEPQVARL